MSIQAQGADGAGRKIAGQPPVTILYTNWRGETARRTIVPGGDDPESPNPWFGPTEWHPQPQYLLSAWDLEKGAYRDFAMTDIKAWGDAAVDAALASPRADSAERTAEEARAQVAAAIGRVMCECGPGLATGVGCFEKAADAVLALRPAPATPPGVPDSVRAPDDLTREQIRGRAKALLVKNGWKPGDNFATQNVVELMATIGMSLLTDPPQDRCAYPECGCDADSVCSTALATHPAGQSAGTGDASRDFQMMLARLISRHSKGLDIAQTIEGARDLLKRKGTLSPLRDKPTPDSTRMGQEGTEGRRLIGPKMTPEQEERIAHNLCGEFGAEAVVANAAFVKAFYAELYAAARPAAPEAQGAWQDISTAPKDGTWVLGWQADVARCGGKPANVVRWFEGMWTGWKCDQPRDPSHWMPLPPAPPSSSGQGGR